MNARPFALAASTLATVLVLAGCGQAGTMSGMDHGWGTTTSPSGVSTDFNAADETFVTMMIPHHEQALEMAGLLLAKDGSDDRVVELAERITAAQVPEIVTMTEWLDAWGIDMMDARDDGMGGMDHDDGMMSEDDMTELQSVDGAEASILFLEQMIQHHRGAIDMAEQEVDNGVNPDAVALAKKIISDQAKEIAEIENLLTEL